MLHNPRAFTANTRTTQDPVAELKRTRRQLKYLLIYGIPCAAIFTAAATHKISHSLGQGVGIECTERAADLTFQKGQSQTAFNSRADRCKDRAGILTRLYFGIQ